jgi:transcriptional regulator with XRE-family HTH domain
VVIVAKSNARKRHPLGERIDQMIRERGLSQRKLAQLVDLRVATISDLINAAEPNPTLDTLNRLAVAFGCSVSDLLGEKKPGG